MNEQKKAEARLIDEIETGRVDEIGQFLLEHLARYGPGDLDIQDLAIRILDRVDEDS